MTGDVRTTLTDAVATLGTIIDTEQKRDAIHLATEPAFAAEKLFPGQDIGLLADGTASASATKKVGIVDPFLTSPVFPGQRFWLIVYPRRITTLRHTWEHPDFASEGVINVTNVVEAKSETEIEAAIRRITEQAENWSTTYREIMNNAHDYEGDSEIWTSNGYFTADDDFWNDYNTITGRNAFLAYMDDGCRGC